MQNSKPKTPRQQVINYCRAMGLSVGKPDQYGIAIGIDNEKYSWAQTFKDWKEALKFFSDHQFDSPYPWEKPTTYRKNPAPKEPATMTPAQINNELNKIDSKVDKLTDRMIAGGRGSETIREIMQKNDKLSLDYAALINRRGELINEIELRTGRRMTAMPSGFKPRRQNPAPKRSTQKAAALYEQFTGHKAGHVQKIDLPDYPEALTVIGPCVAIAYECVRDGEKAQYQHEFKKKAAPLLCSSPDGRQLFLIGGAFKFRDTGINDD